MEWNPGHQTNLWFRSKACFLGQAIDQILVGQLDWWGPPHIRYRQLFIMASDPEILASSAIRQGSLYVLFRHTFDQVEANLWEALGAEVINVLLLNSSNKISWDLEATGRFSVKSLYAKLSSDPVVQHAKLLWQAAMHMKIKVFIRQMIRGRLPRLAISWNTTVRVMAPMPYAVSKKIQIIYYFAQWRNSCGTMWGRDWDEPGTLSVALSSWGLSWVLGVCNKQSHGVALQPCVEPYGIFVTNGHWNGVSIQSCV